MPVYSQNILTDINKYDLNKIKNQTIKKSRKLLKTSKERHLSAFTYFAVGLSDYFFQETGFFDYSDKRIKVYDKEIGSVDDFLKNFRLWDKYRCFVYDDSLNIITMAIGATVFHYANTTPDNKYIEYITRINSEYIFEYLYCPTSCPMYFCYKEGEIIIVHLSDDGKNIVSYPLSELKDWRWLNTGKLDRTE
ncbi:MAG: hypothetical protein LBL04_07365 [Bacteroidales bacterium]|nr:hypothetical protein [Bacteroidales bacterium]